MNTDMNLDLERIIKEILDRTKSCNQHYSIFKINDVAAIPVIMENVENLSIPEFSDYLKVLISVEVNN